MMKLEIHICSHAQDGDAAGVKVNLLVHFQQRQSVHIFTIFNSSLMVRLFWF